MMMARARGSTGVARTWPAERAFEFEPVIPHPNRLPRSWPDAVSIWSPLYAIADSLGTAYKRCRGRGSMPLERRDPVSQPVVAHHQGLSAPIADEGAPPLEP